MVTPRSMLVSRLATATAFAALGLAMAGPVAFTVGLAMQVALVFVMLRFPDPAVPDLRGTQKRRDSNERKTTYVSCHLSVSYLFMNHRREALIGLTGKP